MTLRRRIIRLLDRPGCRFLLSMIANRYGRRTTKANVAVYFDGLWVHRVGQYIFPDSQRFDYYANSFEHWETQAETCFRNAEDYWFHLYKPKRGDVIVDIGAGRGEDVLAFSTAVGPTGKVLAVEAHPATFLILQGFCDRNRLVNTKPINAAVVDRPSTVYIESDDDWMKSTLCFDSPEGGSVPVRGTTLDEICETEGISHINFLKINIEGAEVLALQGLRRAAPMIENLCVACHDFRADSGDGEMYRTREKVLLLLRDLGFSPVLREGDNMPFVRDHVHAFRSR